MQPSRLAQDIERVRLAGPRRACAAACLAIGFGLSACSAAVEPDGQRRGESGLETQASAIQAELDALLRTLVEVDQRWTGIDDAAAGQGYRRVLDLVGDAESTGRDLEQAADDASADATRREQLASLSRLAGQLPVQIGRLKRTLRASGFTRERHAELHRSLEAMKLTSRSLAAQVADEQHARGYGITAGISATDQQAIVAFNGPLLPGSSWYVLDEGHIDAIDVAYEDDELGIAIHDET